MKYGEIVEAVFIERPNRFEAYVEIEGIRELVHVKNTGRCKELLIPGAKVRLEIALNPKRKTHYDLVMVYKKDFGWVNIDSQAPNKVVYEWLKKQNYSCIKPEYNYGSSRLDFYMEKECDQGTVRYLLEVKGCTLEKEGIGYFPDAPTQRGIKHLRELGAAASAGYKCAIAYAIQMEGVKEVRPNTVIDPEFVKALEDAIFAGVEVWFLSCRVGEDYLVIED